MNNKPQKICIIISSGNDKAEVNSLRQGLSNIFPGHDEYVWNVIFVTDDTGVDVKCPEGDFTVIRLSRDFGEQAALKSGLDYVSSDVDAAIILNGNVEHPPEVIARMLELWHKGFKVIHAVNGNPKDFCLIDNQVIDVLKSMPEKDPNLRELLDWTGFPQVTIEYQGKERNEEKNYFRNMVKLPINLLSLPVYVAAILTACGLLGWISNLCTGLTFYVFFLCSIILLSLWLVGEYMRRTYRQTLNRPMYIISEKINFE